MEYLLAQGVDPLSGGAGWVGAGLLGLVLAWLLLKHLPDKDQRHDTEVCRHLAVEERQRKEHTDMLREMMAHNKLQIETVTKALSTDLQALRQALDALRELVEDRIR